MTNSIDHIVKNIIQMRPNLTPKRLNVPWRPVEYGVFWLYLEWIHTFNGFEFKKEVEIYINAVLMSY